MRKVRSTKHATSRGSHQDAISKGGKVNLTALALMSPTLRDRLIKDYLRTRYPNVAKAKHATRMHRSNGTADRWVMLWDSKNVNTAKCVGRCDPKTMQMFVDAELVQRSGPEFREFQPDTANEDWFSCE
jgi:hypothetical protein